MPLMWTNGTISKEERGPGVLWQEGYTTSAISHVDFVYNDARTAGFDRFTIEIYDLECSGYHPLLLPMTGKVSKITFNMIFFMIITLQNLKKLNSFRSV